MPSTNDTVILHLPEGMAYTCHNEGVCCNVFDTIPVDAGVAATLSSFDSANINRVANNPADFMIAVDNPAAPPPQKIARKACGECSMLTSEKLCAIHALAGEAAKPRVCQDFPWRYVETPDGVYVGLSFVCPSVRGNRGVLVTEQSDQLQTRYRATGSIRATPNAIPLNARVTLSWADYLEIESTLTDLLSIQDEPLPVRIIACCLIPGFIDQMLAGQANESAEPISILQITTAMRAGNYAPILRLAHKQTPPAARSRRMFLGMFTSFANTLHRRGQGRLSTVAGVVGQYVRHAAGLGRVTLQPIDATLNRVQIDQAVVPDTGYAANQISRYLSHCVFRKDLALSGDLTRRVRLLALNAALIPWYAAALAGGDKPPTDAQWDEAIGHVERLYGFHSAFYRFFEQNKAFSDIVDSFILKPGYPYALFR